MSRTGWATGSRSRHTAGAAEPARSRSRHASVRSLERYARPGVDSVARHVAERDPAARRRK
ncbi:PmrA [Streptomyces sp. NPDC002602]|uniref:PmrA n=1 Tax=Streptomyces sp. NPDC002602 TaxID=3364654 RepID=UPI0036A6326C